MWAILALIAAMFEGAGFIVEKKALAKEHAMEFSASMIMFALLISTPFWFFADVNELTLNIIGLILLAAVASSLTVFYLAKALRHLEISYTMPFLAFGPLITIIFSYYFLDESISGLQWIGVLLLLFGTYVLYAHEHHNLLHPLKHFFKLKNTGFIFLGMVFYAIAGVLDKKIVAQVSVASYVPLLFFFMAVIFIVMMLIFHNGIKGIENGMRNNVKWLLLTGALTVAYKATIIYALSLPGVLLSLVIPIKKLSSVFSTVIGGELFHEHDVFKKTIACIIMITGAFLILM